MKLTSTFFAAALAALPTLASAAALTNGNLVVYRVGDGTAALSNTGTAVFVDEYTPTGTLVQSIAMPTAASGSQLSLVAGGSATSEGYLNLSGDGRYVSLTGYNAAVGASNPANGAAATPVRTIGLLDLSTGLVDTSTGINDVSGAARSAYTVDGTNIFYAGGSGGFRSQAFGTNGASVNVASTTTNNRVVRAFGTQLYGMTGSGTGRIGTIGTGISNSAGQTFTALPGITSTQATSAYGYFLADLDAGVAGYDTLYIADDAATTGGLQKYSLVSGSWISNGKIGSLSTYRGLDAVVTSSGVQLYVTGSSAIFSVLDTAGYNNAFSTTTLSTVATAGTNTNFRGIAVIPEPATLAVVGLGGLLIARRRRA